VRASKDEGERLNADKISWNYSSLMLHPSFRLVALLSLAFAGTAYAASAEGSAQAFLWIAIILIAARVAALVERFGQSAVLGELIVGVLLGNLSLVGIQFLERSLPIRSPILTARGIGYIFQNRLKVL
jgi:hypothetical protein